MVTTSDPSRPTREDTGSSPSGGRPLLHTRDGGVDGPVDKSVASRMSRQRRRDTAPEIALRAELHRAGLRFRVDHPLPGMPRRRGDVVFTRARLAVFVDGCFWHACPDHATTPETRKEWWTEKLRRNVERDRDTDRRLLEHGWAVLRFWEHDDPVTSADVVIHRYRSLIGGR